MPRLDTAIVPQRGRRSGDYDGAGVPDLVVTFDLCAAVPGTLDRQAILSLFRTVKIGRTYIVSP